MKESLEVARQTSVVNRVAMISATSQAAVGRTLSTQRGCHLCSGQIAVFAQTGVGDSVERLEPPVYRHLQDGGGRVQGRVFPVLAGGVSAFQRPPAAFKNGHA